MYIIYRVFGDRCASWDLGPASAEEGSERPPASQTYIPRDLHAAAVAAMDIPPNQTLYVKNVTDKVKKETLKRQLYLAFSAYGRVIDVVVMKGEQLRYVRGRTVGGDARPTGRLVNRSVGRSVVSSTCLTTMLSNC